MNFDKFHIVAVVSNPIRYESRYKLYEIFAEDIKRKGAQLWTVELQTGARSARLSKDDDPQTIQFWASALPGEVWHKENMINIAMQFITEHSPDWRYLAWVDADLKFEMGAIQETAQRLQHWDVVQMFSHAVDYGPENEALGTHQGYMYCYWHGIEPKNKAGYLQGGHPGFAWAARREALNKLGGLIDFAVLGSADRHMAGALTGRVLSTVHHGVHPNYIKWLKIWEQRAEQNIKRNVGYVPGTIRHMWHGRKADRGYSSRWKILVDNQFDPELDIKKDVSGLWQLTDRNIKLRDDIRKYFRARKEDANTL